MGNRHVHLINPFWNATGGSELHALSLYDELKPHCTPHLWSVAPKPDPTLAAKYPIRTVRVTKGRFPKGGTLVFVGVYSEFGRWPVFTAPRRIIICYTTFDREPLLALVEKLEAMPLGPLGGLLKLQPKAEIAYASELLRSTVNLPGIIELSPFDTTLFAPVDGPANRRFVVGRLSRESPEKHHRDDVPVYHALTAAGMEVRLMGAELLEKELGGVPLIRITAAGAQAASAFLQELDCFYYGTNDTFTETFGRVVFEAMSCGVPAVLHRRGGYVDFIRHGENGFLFDTREEGLRYVHLLKDDVELRARVGAAGRRTVLDMFSPAARRAVIDFYTR